MGADAQNLTGVWQGLYTYPNGEPASFVCNANRQQRGAIGLDPRALRAGGLLERHALCDARRQPKL
jgi:hypothetical protein